MQDKKNEMKKWSYKAQSVGTPYNPSPNSPEITHNRKGNQPVPAMLFPHPVSCQSVRSTNRRAARHVIYRAPLSPNKPSTPTPTPTPMPAHARTRLNAKRLRPFLHAAAAAAAASIRGSVLIYLQSKLVSVMANACQKENKRTTYTFTGPRGTARRSKWGIVWGRGISYCIET